MQFQWAMDNIIQWTVLEGSTYLSDNTDLIIYCTQFHASAYTYYSSGKSLKNSRVECSTTLRMHFIFDV